MCWRTSGRRDYCCRVTWPDKSQRRFTGPVYGHRHGLDNGYLSKISEYTRGGTCRAFIASFALFFGNPFDVVRTEIYVLCAFGLLFAIASVTLAEGSKRVPSGQTALISILETPLAPFFAFLLFMEIPTSATFIGGSIVLFGVLFSITKKT
ncbi:MAG: drug/metabolite transporter (DMT)-like permease [Gammaproteobacteria bacterium]|jgi:drug/metabolite transporter (DMT)-like permease